MYQVKSYLRFLQRSTNQYGVHSPFVYDLLTKCLYDTKAYPEYQTIERYRAKMLADKRVITVKDFGAGSKVFTSDQRQVAAIARNAGIAPKRARMLMRICRYFKPVRILEIGTSLGLATSAMLQDPEARILSLEGCPQTAEIAREALGEHAEIITTEFASFLATPKIQEAKFDLIYFDGNHQQEATLAYFDQLLTTVHNDSVWILDDIHWSPGMSRAWEIIKQNPHVSVTIDTFQWGFVFFRKEQRREDFVVRV